MPTSDLKLHKDLARVREELKQQRALNKKLLVRNSGYDQFIDTLRSVVKSEAGFKYTPLSQELVKGKDKQHSEIAAVAVSDLHLSETVRLEDSCGINVFNSVICANRLWEHVQSVKSILARHAVMYNIKGIWSPLLGDILNGSIHYDHLVSNDLSDPAAVLLASRLLEMFYRELATLGLPITIDAVHGNHARMTPKMPTKRQAHSNLDWLTYETLYDKLVGDDQFNMKVHLSQIGMRKIEGWNYVFEHGISVSGGDEERLEDHIRAIFDDPVYRKATNYQGSSFDQIVIGNTHKSRFLERTIVNGCYTGQNELGMSWRLKPIKASQCMWGITRKRVRTWQYHIDFTEVVSEKPTNPMSEYAVWFMKKHRK